MGYTLLYCVVTSVVSIFLGWMARLLYARFQLSSCEQRAHRIMQEANQEAEKKSKEFLVEARDQLIREQKQQEAENRERRKELGRLESRLTQKDELLEKRIDATDKAEKKLIERKESLDKREAILISQEEQCKNELERVAELTREEAKALLIEEMQAEAKRDVASIISRIEQEAQATAERKARDILVTTIQRLATEVSSDFSVTSVSLPNDEMKGRIIGREGRNIRALETLTGADIVIDDTPEAVVVSCFDPVRKEIARIALERLVLDGRIHPGRIEDIVQKVSREVSQKIYEEGEKVLFDLGIHNMSGEGVRALGRLYFRTSYGQNVLYHSKEVAILAGMIASEVGADVKIAKRAALLHDIGKGVETDSDKNHAEVGMEMTKRMGEDPRIINAVAAHHNDVEPTTIEAIIVQIADAISAARPGARRESIDNYIKRLENLEEIANGFEGVERSYAIQAGRELRVLVNNEKKNDAEAKMLARDIAKKIEDELTYPGKIRVTLIRETRIVEYAR